MISEYVKLSDGIFLIENFYDKYLNLKDIILKNNCEYFFHEGDKAFVYSWVDIADEFNNVSHERRLIDSYCNQIKRSIDILFSTKVTSKSTLEANIYPPGAQKARHDDLYRAPESDDFQIGNDFSSVHFLQNSESGGELYFCDLDIKVNSLENRIVMFESHHIHEVLLIEHGTKISVNHFWKKSF